MRLIEKLSQYKETIELSIYFRGEEFAPFQYAIKSSKHSQILHMSKTKEEALTYAGGYMWGYVHATTDIKNADKLPCHVCGVLISKDELDENGAYSYPEGLPHCPAHYDKELGTD